MSKSGLKEALKAKPGGERLVHSLENIKSKAEPLLSKIVETFPDYTKHEIGHSEKILENLDWFIPNSLREELNMHEIFSLIASVYLHDIGMVNFPELIEKEELKGFLERERIRKSQVTEKQIVRDLVREDHHLRSEKFIIKNFKDFAVEDKHQAEIIGRICRGHRKENLHDRDLFKPDRMYRNCPINVPLLAAILRIGDELDLTFERAPLIIYEHAPPRDDISKNEWEMHLSTSGVGPLSEDPLTIKCSATCKNPKIHRALKRLEIKIVKELEDLPNHLHQYRKFRKDLPRRFFVEIEAEGYKPYDLKFSLQEKEIINLLMGERLYNRREESLRELLKNSVDACRLRRESLKKLGLGYTPTIVFELTSGKRIILSDSGIGMDEDMVERYFTKIGESFYRSPEFLEKGYDFTPVSELGIGILSCFMIADKIVVETKTDDSNPILIEIDDVSDYFIVRKGSKGDTGTTVTLFLKENIKKIDLVEEIGLFARHLEFPVKVKLPSGEEHVIEDVGFEPDFDALLGWHAKGYGFHPIKIDDGTVEGVIALLFEKDEKLGLKPIKKQWELREKIKEINEKKFISNEGIFVARTDIMPAWIDSELIFVDLNLKKGALDLNVSRNDIVRNEKFYNFANRIEMMLINGLEVFLCEIEQKAKKANVNLGELFETLFWQYTNGYRIRDLKKENRLSDKLLDILKRFYYFKCVSKDGINYIKHDKIVESGKLIFFLLGIYRQSDEHIKQIVSGCSGFTEDNLYLLPKYYSEEIGETLFKDIRSSDITSFFHTERSDELKGFIPKMWKLVRFRNYKTSRLIEFARYGEAFLNRDNRFIDLLIKNKHIITGDKKIALEGFFRSLRIDVRKNFQIVLSKQKEILKWFIDARLINENEISNYFLTMDDFPP